VQQHPAHAGTGVDHVRGRKHHHGVTHLLGKRVGHLDRVADGRGQPLHDRLGRAVVEPSASGNSAGHIGLQVTVTNAGSTPCVVEGFPGVSLVTGTEGQQLGAPAKRTSATFPDCTVTPAMGFRVYLPDDTAAQFAPQSQQGCANPAVILMEVGPFAR
jgi:hypothetical protein